MRKKLLLASLIIGSLSVDAFAECPRPNRRFDIQTTTSEYIQFRWDLSSKSKWLSPTEDIYSFQIDAFRSYVESKTDPDQTLLLEKQRALYLNIYDVNSSEIRKFDLMISGETGNVGMTNCLDQLLLSEQFKLVHHTKGTEFVASIFVRNDEIRVLGAFRTKKVLSGPPTGITERTFKNMRRDGWVYYSLLHNHPFSFTNPFGDISGTVIGSDADYYTIDKHIKAYGLRAGRITNGFNSSEFFKQDMDTILRN